MAQPPAEWFRSEVLARLSGVRRGDKPGQFYAHCPVAGHGDRHQSFAIRAGDKMAIVYHCQKDCTNEEIRDALDSLGVPEEHLGLLGKPEYEASRRVRATSEERRELERVHRELAELKNDIRGLLVADLSLALLKVRLLAVVDDVDIPDGRKDYVALAMKAGVSQPRAYAAWKTDPLSGNAQSGCVTRDHVVLTRPGEERQAPQVTGHGGIIEPRKLLSNREEENYRTDKTGNEAA